jgi:hypothetical protein
MINIYIKNVTSKIENLPSYLNNMILDKLSYKEGGFGVRPQTKYLFNPDNGITYSGLIPHVVSILDSVKELYKINDMREVPIKNANFKINPEFSPRDYQENIIRNIGSREIIQAATGA